MDSSHNVPIPYRIIALVHERNRLFAYPLEQMASDIWSARFRCTCCGACCTRAINNHIFLLDHDVIEVKKIDPDACEPAPYPEFCDQNGMLYVSGYALRMKEDANGSCWFLEEGKCRIYDQRFSGCRIYPHMLRRSAGAPGHITWRQFARKDSHTGGMIPHSPSGSVSRLLRRSRNMRMHISPSRSHSLRPFTNILLCITSGMIRKCIMIVCSGTGRAGRWISKCSMPGNWWNTGLQNRILTINVIVPGLW